MGGQLQCDYQRKGDYFGVPTDKNGKLSYLIENFVTLHADELTRLIKVLGRQLTSLEELRCQTAANLHDGFEHLVVAVPSKQDLARVQFVESTANGPHVDAVIVWHTQNELRCSVEATYEIGSDAHVSCSRIRTINGCAQVANLENSSGLVYLLAC